MWKGRTIFQLWHFLWAEVIWGFDGVLVTIFAVSQADAMPQFWPEFPHFPVWSLSFYITLDFEFPLQKREGLGIFLSCLLSFFPCFCYMHTSSLLGRSHQRRDSGLEPTSLQLVQPYSYLLKMWGFWVKRSLDYFHSKHRRFGDDWTNGFLNSFWFCSLMMAIISILGLGCSVLTLSGYSGPAQYSD